MFVSTCAPLFFRDSIRISPKIGFSPLELCPKLLLRKFRNGTLTVGDSGRSIVVVIIKNHGLGQYGAKPHYSMLPKKTWTEIVEKDCKARALSGEDAMDR